MNILTNLVRVVLIVGIAFSIPLLYAMAKDMKGWLDEN